MILIIINLSAIMDKLNVINEYLNKNDFIEKIFKEENIDDIYNILINQNIDQYKECNNDELYYCVGIYYCVNKNYDEMKKYYLLAIKLNNIDAMNSLGYYYQDIEKNYDEMMKYFLPAINLNNSNAMYNLGYYYDEIEQNYDEMKKYYLQAIDLNNPDSMKNLGVHYENIEKKYDLALKYYLLAIHNGYSEKIYFKCVKDVELTFDIVENIDPNPKFPTYINSYIKLYKQHIKLINEKIDLIELPFKYAPSEAGFQEAKADFLDKYEIKMNNKIKDIINN